MLFALVIVIIASTTCAFASENTDLPNPAGEGTGTISGYEVTNIGYHLNTDPARIDSVTFTLNAPATVVKIKLVDAGSTWYECTVLSSNNWTCDTPGTTTESVDTLTVSATSN